MALPQFTPVANPRGGGGGHDHNGGSLPHHDDGSSTPPGMSALTVFRHSSSSIFEGFPYSKGSVEGAMDDSPVFRVGFVLILLGLFFYGVQQLKKLYVTPPVQEEEDS